MNNNHLHIIEDSRLTLYMLKNSLNDIYSVSVSSDRRKFIDFLNAVQMLNRRSRYW